MKQTFVLCRRLCVLLLILGFLFTACKKGDTGPMGPSGKDGEQGPIGITGSDGTDGTVMYSGTAAPATSLGQIGDFYLNKTTTQLYGPKSASGWGTATSLKGSTGSTGATGATGSKGATGASGAEGSVILSGTVVPAVSIGKTGDYYLNKANSLFYGPKTASSWGTPVSLKGAKGDKGDPGNANVVSSGWKTIPAEKWSPGYGAGDIEMSQAGDLGNFFSSSALGSITEAVAQGGIVLVYAKLPTSPNSSRLLPFKFDYSTTGYKGVVELRFAYGTTPNTAHWVEPSAALVSGTWNKTSSEISQKHLPTVQFCLVYIPASNISALGATNMSDYETVKRIYHLKD